MVTTHYADIAPTRGSGSPWGMVQTAREMHPGIYSVDTAEHGGIWISDKFAEIIHNELPDLVTPYSTRKWFEEDCDWAIPVLLLHKSVEWLSFSWEDITWATHTVCGMREGYMKPVWEWVRSEKGVHIRQAICDREVQLAKHAFCKTGGGVPVTMTRYAWESIHPDFRNADATNPMCLVLMPTGETCSVPVGYIDDTMVCDAVARINLAVHKP